MKLREVVIKNFRNLVDIRVPIGDTTVLVGGNNSGKTAFLDALRIALPPRSPTGRAGPFDEYDYHMCKAGDSSQTSEGIVIELWFREDKSGEWPDSLIQALSDITQTDPHTDLDCIGLRLSSKYDETSKEIVPRWEFVTIDGQALRGKGASPGALRQFLSYVRFLYLSSLRDAHDEFSPRSQFWGRILRDLKITEEQRETLAAEFTRLNAELLDTDARVEQVRTCLAEATQIMGAGAPEDTSIRALPLSPWDLMSKSEVVIKPRGNELYFPLSRHGQGIQSLTVIFLFQAYIDVFLRPGFEPETEAILALEEPEAHLHPHAARALAASLSRITSQKIISSHSPHFIQEIPFTQIRLFRQNGPSARVLYVKRSFSVEVPNVPELSQFWRDRTPKFVYHEQTSTLTVHGRIDEEEYRELLQLYPGQKEVHARLKQLRTESELYLSDEDLVDLETYAKRIRGEVLFARAWLLCEGQSDYLLLRYFAELLGYALDRLGVTVIDFQNNGSAGAFVGLARVFQVPWILICDNDEQGKQVVEQVRDRGLTDEEIRALVRPLPEADMDLEMFLVKNGFAQDYIEILSGQGIPIEKKQGEEGFEAELALAVKRDKTGYAVALIQKLREAKADGSRVPTFLATVIGDIVAKVV